MLKQVVKYTDFDGVPQEETLYFFISRSSLLANLELEDELKDVLAMFNGPERELTPVEIRRILDMVKKVMSLAYGVRSEDGKRFDQNPQLWEDFQKTAVYEAFIWQLFENPSLANQFMISVMPAELRDKVVDEAKKQGVDLELPA